MLKKQINKLVSHYGIWRLIHIVLAAGIAVLTGVFVLELVTPIQQGCEFADAAPNMSVITTDHLSEILEPKLIDFQEIAEVLRPGFFKASTQLRDQPMADKTLERIKSQLKLQCVMESNNEPVAYVNIEGTGLKKCKVGDCVNDLFTVVNINKNSVEITIIGHKVILSL